MESLVFIIKLCWCFFASSSFFNILFLTYQKKTLSSNVKENLKHLENLGGAMAPSSYNVALSVNTQPIALSQEANETRISTFYTLKT